MNSLLDAAMKTTSEVRLGAIQKDLPSWVKRDFSHMRGPGRWYAHELVAMARHAVAESLPKIKDQSMSGQNVALYLYSMPASAGNWGDIVLLGRDEKAPKGFSIVSAAPVITGSTPYQNMVSVLTDNYLNRMPLLPGVKSPYVPLAERGRNAVMAMAQDENNDVWTVSFREAGSYFLRDDKRGSVEVLQCDNKSGFVVQKDGSGQMSSGHDSFWYLDSAEGKDLALRMLGTMAKSEKYADEAMDSQKDPEHDEQFNAAGPGL